MFYNSCNLFSTSVSPVINITFIDWFNPICDHFVDTSFNVHQLRIPKFFE